ncbi:integrase [Bosea sp. BE271]|uniref:tyrosine-type recombinase/integrase n=1 Tax=Bosea TaxID=85413 RepID=UPI002867311B|nr:MULTISPECIES: tyrosine-type recombinase/integrase [Bosea]MDR6827969.1 integrase [Bosea robiniae]MDR6894881.1 integrase [Bosea sp. BE109]MDR7138075.1 integrase [Bosea sp. BE168]MDR7174774.1 integrase [Bosea sp. BE271]
MPSKSTVDARYLEPHGPQWRVTYPVPADLRLRMGKTRLKRPLGTGDLKKASKLKRAVIVEFDKLIEAERRAMRLEAKDAESIRFLATPIQKGLQFRKLLDDPDNDAEGRQSIRMDIDLEHGLFLGKPIGMWDDGTGEEEPIELYDEQKEADAALFLQTVYPNHYERRLEDCRKAYIEKLTIEDELTARTIADDERAFRYLKEWCEANGHSFDMRKFTELMAYNFLREMDRLTGRPIANVTKNKYVNRLKKFWVVLRLHELAGPNVWTDQLLKNKIKSTDERERAFTMDEVRRLLMGKAPRKLHDVIMIGLLTGARLEAIVRLKVEEVGKDFIVFQRMKKEVGSRVVPMHPELAEIFKRRTANRKPKDDVFPDWPAAKKAGSMRERSFKASNAFTAYRQREGVDVHDRLPGSRRSRVNFHSCRRWFITHFRRTASLNLTRAVVGHSQASVTDGIYAGGPLFHVAMKKLLKVQLPPLTDQPVEDPPGINLFAYTQLDKDDPDEANRDGDEAELEDLTGG